MNWHNKKVLVTGAGGFIGSHLTERLAREGAQVRALTHYNALGRRGWLDSISTSDEIEVMAGDITDRDRMAQAMQGIDIVYHLAALIAIPYSYYAPASYVHTNVLGTLNVLQIAREIGIERVIHTSTSEVYGTARYIPIDEKHPLQGQSPYSASKIGADKMAEAYFCSFGLPVVIVRPFNTFGPRQSSRAVIPTIISQLLVGERVHLGSLDPIRDLNYVTNTVDGFVLASDTPDTVGGVFNLGSGREISIRDLAHLIASLMGRTITIITETERIRPANSEVDRLLGDNTRAHEIMGWSPIVPLEEGLQQTVEWIKKHQEFYRNNDYAI